MNSLSEGSYGEGFRGFNDGAPKWEVFLQAPVSTGCTVYVATTGTITAEGLDKLIEYINLVKDNFKVTKDEIPAGVGSAESSLA